MVNYKESAKSMKVNYSYLHQQFKDVDDYFRDLRHLVSTGEFTLGPFVEEFERKFSNYIGIKHVISTNTGTDALIMALKSVGVKPGDEVITVPNTFVATVGAIVATGARPVFVDCDDRYQMNVSCIEKAITSKTSAVLPVHWAGSSPEIEMIIDICNKYNLPVVEDACPAVGAKVNGKCAGTFGRVNAFSMHPLKPLNVWGDGGMVVTNNDEIADWLRLYRNHGLKDRDHVEFWGINARLQPVQAVVGSRLLDTIEDSLAARIHNARVLDEGMRNLFPHVRIPERPGNHRAVYQLYQVSAAHRDELLVFLQNHGVEARVHYPIPLHLQKAAQNMGYRRGDFPVCERQASEIITLPAHAYITADQIEYLLQMIRDFYRSVGH